MKIEAIGSPIKYLEQFLALPDHGKYLWAYEDWWKTEGSAISESVDRSGTPWLRMFDKLGARVDQILFQTDYWRLLRKGYEAGILWRAFDEMSLMRAYELLYIVSFFDPGLACPYTVSLSTAIPIFK